MRLAFRKLTALALSVLLSSMTVAEADDAPPVQAPSGDAEIEKALSGGVPLGRWNEGLLFEGIEPQPWLKSAANWFPNTEEIQPEEMRIIFL